jgi:hypothetical protein
MPSEIKTFSEKRRVGVPVDWSGRLGGLPYAINAMNSTDSINSINPCLQ